MELGDRIEVVLELEAMGPIQGHLAAPAQPARAFYGWLELAGALERARRAGASPRLGVGARKEGANGAPAGG